MPDYMETIKSPGLWMAVAAVILNMASKSLARALKPNDEDAQTRVTLWLKTLSLVLAIGGFIIVVKTFLF